MNNEKVGDDLKFIKSQVRPLYVELTRKVQVEIIADEEEDERTEHYTEEEWTDCEEIPAQTGFNNIDSGLTDGDKSTDSAEAELREIETKRKEEEEDERNYTKDDSVTK